MGNALLDVIDLSVTVRSNDQTIPILKKINFSVDKGETVALVGESGSGKSMTALAIMQLLPVAAYIELSSTLLLEGEDLLTLSEINMRSVRGRKIALIFQEAITALNPVMTIGEQIVEVIYCHFKVTKKVAYQKAIALLDEVGIPRPSYHYNVYPHQLSGGLKQRAMIAIALAGEPDLLIADEPTTALDVTLQAQIINLLKKLQSQRGMGLLFITHDLGIVYEVADKVIVLYKGEVVEAAKAEIFFKNPQHLYSKKLFASLPGWLPSPEKLQSTNDDLKDLVEVTHLKVYYPIKKGLFKRTVGYVKAVDDVSLCIKQGQTLALVGESGSGKTTTGMAICRLTPVTSGDIIFDNINLADLSGHQLRMARDNFQVVFQDPYSSMNPRMLVGNIIAEGMKSLKIPVKNPSQRIDELLRYVGLEPEAKFRYPHEFSGGQRQRICIARALALEPKLLICDEPTSALDVSAQMQVLQLLLKLQREMGLTYLLITHNLAVVAYMADEMAVMQNGKIVEIGSVSKVLNHPQNVYTQKLLKAVPQIPADSKHSFINDIDIND